jgi:hypothetical protein
LARFSDFKEKLPDDDKAKKKEEGKKKEENHKRVIRAKLCDQTDL